MLEIIKQPWPWYVAGPSITFVMFLLLLFGKRFGLSSNLRTMCAMGGCGKYADFFNFDWKAQVWNLIFVAGSITGGFIAVHYLSDGSTIQLSGTVVTELQSFGIANPGDGLVPQELFSWESVFTLKGFILIIIGGFLVGFGTRYAGGCTSGHAISGLSDLQLPSLIATIGFFIGGLITTYFILPYILAL